MLIKLEVCVALGKFVWYHVNDGHFNTGGIERIVLSRIIV